MSFFEWLKPSIDRGVKKGIDDFVSGPKFAAILDDFVSGPKFVAIIDRVVRDEMRKPEYRWFWFIKAMQARMLEVDKSLDGKRAWELALAAFKGFLRSERIEFGDPRYSWDRDGARDLIQDMEIDHWETQA